MPTAQTVSATWNMACPACGDDEQIDIAATVYIRLCLDGTDISAAENGDHEWTENSPAQCCTCGYTGTVRQFLITVEGADEGKELPDRFQPC